MVFRVSVSLSQQVDFCFDFNLAFLCVTTLSLRSCDDKASSSPRLNSLSLWTFLSYYLKHWWCHIAGGHSVGLKPGEFADSAYWSAFPLSTSGAQPGGRTCLVCFFPGLELSSMGQAKVKSVKEKGRRRDKHNHPWCWSGKGQGGGITNRLTLNWLLLWLWQD